MNTVGKYIWTDEMILKLQQLFPVMYNKELAKILGVSWRTLVHKARELNVYKEPCFLEKRRAEITKMAVEAHPPNPHKGDKGWTVPNSEKYQFKTGNTSCMKNPVIADKVRNKRNEIIRIERLRIKYGLNQKTNLKLNVW